MPRRKQVTPQRLKLKPCSDILGGVASSLKKERARMEDIRQSPTEHDAVIMNRSKEIPTRPLNYRSSPDNSKNIGTSPEFSYPNSATCSENKQGMIYEMAVATQCISEDDEKIEQSTISDSNPEAASTLRTLAAAAAFCSDTTKDTILSQENGVLVKMGSPVRRESTEKQPPSLHSDLCNYSTDLSCASEASPKEKTTNAQQPLKPFYPLKTDHVVTSTSPGKNLTQQQTRSPENLAKTSPRYQKTQLDLVEAMLHRQREMCEESADNKWMKMQKNDHNCLTKSKAERYRWCVQNESSCNSHKPKTAPTNAKEVDCSVPKSKKLASVIPTTKCLQDKLFSTVFTGASKFRCRDCSSQFNTLVDLTVHMSNTGHYRDQNPEETGYSNSSSKISKPHAGTVRDVDEKESAEKVLKCLHCGHSFDSLQDLSVHMIRTKHYEDVPSLRFFSQKHDLIPHIPKKNNDQEIFMPSKHIRNKSTKEITDLEPRNAHMSSTSLQSTDSEPNPFELGVHSPTYSSISDFANLHALAAQTLMRFPPYFMTLPFPVLLNGYCAKASDVNLLSPPWLTLLPGLASAGILPPVRSPHFTFPSSLMSQITSVSSVDKEDISASELKSSITEVETKSTSASLSTKAEEQPSPSRCKSEVPVSESNDHCCVQCGQSLRSLQNLINHMQQEGFICNNNNNNEETSETSCKPPKLECPTVSRSVASSQHPLTSRFYDESFFTPLERLAKLSSAENISLRTKGESSKSDDENMKNDSKTSPCKIKSLSSTPVSSTSVPYSKPMRNGDKCLPSVSPCNKTEDLQSLDNTGFSIIKSLESTIQNAISKVRSSSATEQKKMFHCERKDTKRDPSRFPPVSQHNANVPFVHAASDSALFTKSSSLLNDPFKRNDTPVNQSLDSTKSDQRSPSCSVQDTSSMPLNLTNSKHSHEKSDTTVIELTSKNTLSTSVVGHICGRKKLVMNSDDIVSGGKQTNLNSESRKTRDKYSPVQGSCNIRNTSPAEITNSVLKGSIPASSKRHIGHPAKRPDDDEEYLLLQAGCKDSPHNTFHESRERCRDDSNPLQEIEKIVNSAELTSGLEILTDDNKKSLQFLRHRQGSIKRGLYTEYNPSDAKRCKVGSILSDLVVHENDSPFMENPLVKMEKLVKLRIGHDASQVKKGRRSTVTSFPKENITKKSFSRNHCRIPVGTNNFEDKSPAPARPSSFNEGTYHKQHTISYHQTPHTHRLVLGRDWHGRVLKQTKKTKSLPNDKSVSPTTNKLPNNVVGKKTSPPVHTARLRDRLNVFFREMDTQNQMESDKGHTNDDTRTSSENGDCTKLDNPSGSSTKCLSMQCYNKQKLDFVPRKEISVKLTQEILLQIHYVSQLDRIQDGLDFSEDELDKMAKKAMLTHEAVKEWLISTKKKLLAADKNNFIQYSESNDDSHIFRCTACEDTSLMTSVNEFIKHLCRHLDAELSSSEYFHEEKDYSQADAEDSMHSNQRPSGSNSSFMVAHVQSPEIEETSWTNFHALKPMSVYSQVPYALKE